MSTTTAADVVTMKRHKDVAALPLHLGAERLRTCGMRALGLHLCGRAALALD